MNLEKLQQGNEYINSQTNLNTTIPINLKEQQMTFGDDVEEKSGMRFGESYRRKLLEHNNSTSFIKLNYQNDKSVDLGDGDKINSPTPQYRSKDKISPFAKKKKTYIHDGKQFQTSSSFQKFLTQRIKKNKLQDENNKVKSEIRKICENDEQEIQEVGEQKQQFMSKNVLSKELSQNMNSDQLMHFGSYSIDRYNQGELVSNENNQVSKQEVEKKNIWLRSFFKIIGHIAKFKYHLKKQLIFRNPDLLQKNQILMIDDKGAKGFEEMDQSNLKNGQNLYKESNFSKFKYIRRMRKKMLIIRKKLKVIWVPTSKFFKACFNIIKQLFDQIDFPLFSPISPFIMVWDILNIILIFIQTLYITFNIAFGSHLQVISFEIATEVVFIFNIAVQCNLSYYEKGIQINSRKAILNNFLKNSLFSEVLALIGLFMREGDPIQLLFFFKFPQFHHVVNKYKENNQFNLKVNLMFNISVLLIEVVQFCHFLCCFWYVLGKYNLEHDHKSWLKEIDQKNIYSVYITCLYFCVISITTIGYGDIVAKHEREKIFVVFMSLTATGIFGYTINRMNNILDEYYKLSDINFYMNQREVSYKIQNRKLQIYSSKYLIYPKIYLKINILIGYSSFIVFYFNRNNIGFQIEFNLQIYFIQRARNYLEYIYREGYINNEKVYKSLNSLSSNIIEAIEGDVYYKALKKIDIFSQNFSKGFLQRVALKVKELNYGIFVYAITPDEEIIKRGNVGSPILFIIIRGEVEVFVDSNQDKYAGTDSVKSFCILDRNSTFGLDEFLTQEQVHTYSARSKGISRIQSLSSADFFDVIKEYPKDREIYQNIKDRIIQHKTYSETRLYCYSCKSSRHLVGQCPFIQFIPNQLKLYNNLLRSEKELQQSFKRNTEQTKFPTLTKQALVEEGMIILLEQNNLIEWVSEASADELNKENKEAENFTQAVKPKSIPIISKDDTLFNISEEELEKRKFEKKALRLLISRTQSKDVSNQSPIHTLKYLQSPTLLVTASNRQEFSPSNISTTQGNQLANIRTINFPTKLTDYFQENSGLGDFSNLIKRQQSEALSELNPEQIQLDETTRKGDETNKTCRSPHQKKKRYSINIRVQKPPQYTQSSHFKKESNSNQNDDENSFENDDSISNDQKHILYLLSKQSNQQQKNNNPNVQINSSNIPFNPINISVARKASSPKRPTLQPMNITDFNNANTNININPSNNEQLFQNKLMNLLVDFLSKNKDESSQNKLIKQEFDDIGIQQTNDIAQYKMYQTMMQKQNEDFDILREYQYYFPHNNIHEILKKIYQKFLPKHNLSKFSSLKKIKRTKTHQQRNSKK